MNFIKKIFENKIDESVHNQFKRFSKGIFENRALIEISNSKKVKIKTSFEFSSNFLDVLVNTIVGKVKVTGGIISVNKNLAEDIGFGISGKKQFQGVITYLIDCEITKEQLQNAMNKYKDALFLLTFETVYGSLKTKVKSPKSTKPGKDDEKPKVDFCLFVTGDKGILNDFAFDVGEFSKLSINHTFVIDSLVVPDQYKNDFALARIHAKRKGKIIRKLEIDGKLKVNECAFEA